MLTYTRRLIGTSHGWSFTGALAAGYALLSMVLTGMVRFSGTASVRAQWVPNLSGGPGIILQAFGLSAVLPLESSALTILVALVTGVGLGAGTLVTFRLAQSSKSTKKGTGTAASIAALTPAMMAMVTLGACCSMVAASSSGFFPGARSPEITLGAWTVPSLILGLAQLGLLMGAVSAQERIFATFADLLSIRSTGSQIEARRGRRWTRRFITGTSFTVSSIGLGSVGTFAFLTLIGENVGMLRPANALLAGLFQGNPLSEVVLIATLAPALLLMGASQRTVGWLSPAFRSSVAGFGLSYLSNETVGSFDRVGPLFSDLWRNAPAPIESTGERIGRCAHPTGSTWSPQRVATSEVNSRRPSPLSRAVRSSRVHQGSSGCCRCTQPRSVLRLPRPTGTHFQHSAGARFFESFPRSLTHSNWGEQ